MSILWRAGFCVAVLALAVSPVVAQQQGRGLVGLHGLVGNKSVQEELKLNDDQKAKVTELTKKAQSDMEEKTKDLTGADRRTKMPAIMKELNDSTSKSLAGILKEEQLKRLKQIQLQREGVRAFANEQVQKALKFSDAQTREVKEILDAAQKQIQEDTKDIPRDDAAKRRQVTQKINREAREKVMGKLSDDQKTQWKEMTGEPFQVRVEQQ